MTRADERLYSSYIRKLSAYIEARGMRKTQERFAILEAVCKMGGHFTAEMLSDAMNNKAYHVSVTSIYNTLDILLQAGIVTCHTFGAASRTYELQKDSSHIHLICSQCGKIREVFDAELARSISLRRFGTFAVNSFSIDIFGTCASCSRSNRKNINKKTNPQNNGKS